MRKWGRCNRLAGYIVFGLPVIPVLPVWVVCLVRFGVRGTVTQAVPAGVWVAIPLLVWVLWAVRPARSVAARVVMVVSLATGLVTIVVSPLFFWAGPAAAVLASEAARGLVVTIRARQRGVDG